jgi:hypothetical protein
MKRLKFLRWRTVVGAVVGGLLLLYGFSVSPVGRACRANLALSSRKLPALPFGATGVHCWAGGIFAKYMNIKCAASADQVLDYLRRADASYYFEFQADEMTYHVVATHWLPGTRGTYNEMGLVVWARGPYCGKSWFHTVRNIRHGWQYHSMDGPTVYDIYYDLESQQFYLYWRYS